MLTWMTGRFRARARARSPALSTTALALEAGVADRKLLVLNVDDERRAVPWL
jgi:hypothetical protein